MQVQLDISFEQLVEVVKTLPEEQRRQLKAEMDREMAVEKHKKDLKTLLLNGPVATQKQLEIIENNRKSINQWREALS